MHHILVFMDYLSVVKYHFINQWHYKKIVWSYCACCD